MCAGGRAEAGRRAGGSVGGAGGVGGAGRGEVEEDAVLEGLGEVQLPRCLPAGARRVVLVPVPPAQVPQQAGGGVAEVEGDRVLRLGEGAALGGGVGLADRRRLGRQREVHRALPRGPRYPRAGNAARGVHCRPQAFKRC